MSFGALLSDDLRAWLRPRSIALVLVACLVPPGLTAAWVFTHQADVSSSSISFSPDPIVAGKMVNITGTFANSFGKAAPAFNASLQVGYFYNDTAFHDCTATQAATNGTFCVLKQQKFRIPALEPGQSAAETMNWTAAQGSVFFRTVADTDNTIPEIEEKNNDRFVEVNVPYHVFNHTAPPQSREEANSTLPPVDLAVRSVTWGPADLYLDQGNAFHILVANNGTTAANGTLHFFVTNRARVLPIGGQLYMVPDYQAGVLTPTRTVTLGPGNSTTVDFPWTPNEIGDYAIDAYVDTNATHDTDHSNDEVATQTYVDRHLVYYPPPPKQTAKEFYSNTLANLHLRIIIPLVAIFYAAGLVEDDRTRAALPYLLTRPVPRWQIPIARFTAMALVGTLAVGTGIAATYILLLGMPQSAAGLFVWPLLFGVACLLSYGALFTAIGAVARRPYLVSMVYVLGIESLIYIGQNYVVGNVGSTGTATAHPIIQDWVADLSLTQWMLKAFHGWTPDAGWLPAGPDASQALLVIAGVTIGGLVAATAWIKRREFNS